VQLPSAQVAEHWLPEAQLAWQGGARQPKEQLLFGPQVQSPLAHSPSQRALFPTQLIVHGGAPHGNVQSRPFGHWQLAESHQ
jgi:hypothetical protein